MKILTWNIQCGASFGWNNQREIKSAIVDKIIEQDTSVIVLTEFAVIKGLDYLLEQFEKKEYIYFNSSCSGKNGIFIAVKKILVDYNKIKTDANKRISISSNIEGCNILRVEIPLKEHGNLIIVGCRMETGLKNKDLKSQYDYERECFDNILIPMIKPIRKDCKYIICGDFNNARCIGKTVKSDANLNDAFNPKHYVGFAQCNYNLHIIKDEFEKIGFEMVDKNSDGAPIPTHKIFPDDHIFVNGFTPRKCQTINTDMSDHEILLGEVEWNNYE